MYEKGCQNDRRTWVKKEMKKVVEKTNSVMIIDFDQQLVSVKYNKNMLLEDAMKTLSKEQHEFFNSIMDFITMHKRITSTMGKFRISFYYRDRQLIKMYLKNGFTAVSFNLENETYRKIKKKATSLKVDIADKDTEIVVKAKEALDVVFGIVELRMEIIDADLLAVDDEKSATGGSVKDGASKDGLVLPQQILQLAKQNSNSYVVLVVDADGTVKSV